MTALPLAWVPVWSSSWDPWVRLFAVSPGFSSRGVCACVTHPEVQVGRYTERTSSAGLGAPKEQINLGKTPSLCALRKVVVAEAAGWERKDKRKPLIYQIL